MYRWNSDAYKDALAPRAEAIELFIIPDEKESVHWKVTIADWLEEKIFLHQAPEQLIVWNHNFKPLKISVIAENKSINKPC